MKIHLKIDYKREYEIERIADTCSNIADNFFQSKRFLISKTPKKGVVIFLPFLQYSSINNYWKKVKGLDPIMIKRKGNPLFTEMKKLSLKGISQKKIEDFEIKAKGDIQEFAKNINKVFPQLGGYNLKITVRPTLYGTQCSFPQIVTRGKMLIIDYVWIRIDSGIPALLESILSSLVYFTLEHKRKGQWHGPEWDRKEYIVDFLMQHTAISGNAKGFAGTIKALEENILNEDLVNESKKYYAELGFPMKSIFRISNLGIYAHKKMLKNLTTAEELVLRQIFHNKDKVTTYEEIGDLLWKQDGERFSLWAIAKVVQRIREKLKENGILQEVIHTLRNKGYVMYD